MYLSWFCGGKNSCGGICKGTAARNNCCCCDINEPGICCCWSMGNLGRMTGGTALDIPIGPLPDMDAISPPGAPGLPCTKKKQGAPEPGCWTCNSWPPMLLFVGRQGMPGTPTDAGRAETKKLQVYHITVVHYSLLIWIAKLHKILGLLNFTQFPSAEVSNFSFCLPFLTINFTITGILYNHTLVSILVSLALLFRPLLKHNKPV